jgi:hypothetical protein
MKRFKISNKEPMKTPKIGVFWYINGKFRGLDVEYNDPYVEFYGKFANVKFDHFQIWDHYKPKGDIHDYTYYPRGRVIMNAELKKYKVIADEKIINDLDVRKKLLQHFELDSEQVYEWDTDFHYVSESD